jgi:hypothetical protein
MGKTTISMAIFNGKLSVYQRVKPPISINWHLNTMLNPHESIDFRPFKSLKKSTVASTTRLASNSGRAIHFVCVAMTVSRMVTMGPCVKMNETRRNLLKLKMDPAILQALFKVMDPVF